MDTDKAYLLGLVIGGGIWGNSEDSFRIRLPYKQWGSYAQDPRRAGQISRDIMTLVSPLFRAVYGLNISYATAKSGEWNILCEGDLTTLKSDLAEYGIKCEGELRKTAEIDEVIEALVDDNMKRRFVAGLADTIGSTKQSHRRFTEDKQMISFEISGFSFNFVCKLCGLLHSLQCYPDQILWNHPNFHCGNNPYDTKWKKGFKLRVYLDQYEKFGSFAFTAKVDSSKENMELESQTNTAEPCEERVIKPPNISSFHHDENSLLLPEVIRNGHYIHNRHVCAVLKCPHAPYGQVQNILDYAEEYISPFPVLAKGTDVEVLEIVSSEPLFNNRNYLERYFRVYDLYSLYINDSNSLLFSKSPETGYPINQIMKAITFFAASELGKLKGLRPSGKMDILIKEYLKSDPNVQVKILKPDLLTPIIIICGKKAALVGAKNPTVYKRLIIKDPTNEYKIILRAITESDLR